MIAGIVLNRTSKILVRTQGPSLIPFGVTNAVADPDLQIVDSEGNTIATNANWADSPDNSEMLPGGDLEVYAPGNANEAAIVLDLPAGVYTALVSSPGDRGVGIVEVFELE